MDDSSERVSMNRRPFHPIACGTASVVLGAIATMLFWLPILGISIAVCGLLAGIWGIIGNGSKASIDFRWAIVGCAISMVAIWIGGIIAYTPIVLQPIRAAEAPASMISQPAFIPPPARPH